MNHPMSVLQESSTFYAISCIIGLQNQHTYGRFISNTNL